MIDEVLVNVTLDEVRVVALSACKVVEVHIERLSVRNLTGNIYSGRICRLLPSLQAVFVDIGIGRPGFLRLKDAVSGNNISQVDSSMQLGDKVMVQVVKEALGEKGPRLTMNLALVGRLLVLTPNNNNLTVSRKITDAAKAELIISKLNSSRFGGYIIRTMAQFTSLDALSAEQISLDIQWESVLDRMATAKVGSCVYVEPSLECRALRDFVVDSNVVIRVDNESTCNRMRSYAENNYPHLVDLIYHYKNEKPIFSLYESEKKLQQLLQRRVYLRSGAYLVFDQTEAMTTIDVNTGSTKSKKSNQEFIFQINTEAAAVIADQVRLRNLGGIIIIDFIDMKVGVQSEKLLAVLIKSFSNDTAYTKFSELTRLGLVQMTRKRARKSLLSSMCVPCSNCHQLGMVKSCETVAYDIVRDLKSMLAKPWKGFLVQASPDVVEFLLQSLPVAITHLEEYLGRRVKILADFRYRRAAWEILPLVV